MSAPWAVNRTNGVDRCGNASGTAQRAGSSRATTYYRIGPASAQTCPKLAHPYGGAKQLARPVATTVPRYPCEAHSGGADDQDISVCERTSTAPRRAAYEQHGASPAAPGCGGHDAYDRRRTQLLRGPIRAAPVAPGPSGFASKAPIQIIVPMTCAQNYCSGDTPTTGVGQTLEVLFVSCFVHTDLTDDFLTGAVGVVRGDTTIAGHFLGATWRPHGRSYVISQPIFLTVPPEHFLRFEAASLAGPLSAICTMSSKS